MRAKMNTNEKKAEFLANKITKIAEKHLNPSDMTDFDDYFASLVDLLQEETRFGFFTELEKNIISNGLHSLTTLPKSKSIQEGKKALLALIREIKAAFDPNNEFYESETWQNTSESEEQAEINREVPKWGTRNRKLCLNGNYLGISDMSKGIEIKLDQNLAYSIIKELKKQFNITREVPPALNLSDTEVSS